jgi:SagB-type dehydrogenase family enzyme
VDRRGPAVETRPASTVRRVSTADVARSYHDRTAHTWRSVRAGGGQLDWGAQPLSVKVYPDLEPLRLPLDLVTSDWPALDALAGVWPPNRSPWSLQRVASLLFHTAGVTRRWERDGVPRAFRAAPSAGALYPVETYVVCGDLPGLEAGVHHFEPLSWTLRRLRDGDLRGTLAEAVVDEATAAAPLSVVLTGVPGRSTWKYRARGYRHVWWDAGAMVAHLLALADGLGEPARVLTGFLDRAVGALLGCDDEFEHPLVVVPVGEPIGPPARPTATPRPLTHRHLPLLRRGGSDPELLAVHRTGDLPSRRAVFDWRESMRSLRLTTGTHEVEAPLLGAYDTIEDVVLRRGATRRFDRTPVPGDALARVGGRPARADGRARAGRRLRDPARRGLGRRRRRGGRPPAAPRRPRAAPSRLVPWGGHGDVPRAAARWGRRVHGVPHGAPRPDARRWW